jgi:hypothetical protein
MSELNASDLERGYRRLLACYPRAYRRENEEEILSVLLACARDGQQRPGLAASADLIKGAMRMRLWPAARTPGTVRTAARLVCAGVAVQAAYLIITIATASRVRSAYARMYPPWATPAVYHSVNAHLAIDRVTAATAIGLWLLLAWALVRRRNLARFALAACFGLTSVQLLQGMGQDGVMKSPADMAAGTAIWLLELAVNVLLFTGASNRYYRPEPQTVALWLRSYVAGSATLPSPRP